MIKSYLEAREYLFKMLTLIVHSYILFFFITRIDGFFTCNSDFCGKADESDIVSDVYLIYYNCSDNNSRTYYPLIASENITKKFDENKPTVIYIFGWMQYPDHPNVQSMMNALCFGSKANVVLLDWSNYSNSINYLNVSSNSQKVGESFGRYVEKLNLTYNVSNIYVIGFSLGAHIAGFAGRCINRNISRITGLDPANPETFVGCYLKSDDAEWVDIIHSDMCKFGTPYYLWMGTTHFFINGGYSPQPPNCTDISLAFYKFLQNPISIDQYLFPVIFCSHRKAVDVFIVTIYNSTIYYATQCPSSKQFLNECPVYEKNECNGEQNSVGFNAKNIPGPFMVNTYGQ